MDWQRNDHLGRGPEHGREILRGIWSNTNTYTHGNCYTRAKPDANAYSYSYSHGYTYGYSYAYTHAYANGYSHAHCNANCHSNSHAYTDSYAYTDVNATNATSGVFQRGDCAGWRLVLSPVCQRHAIWLLQLFD
jgi:hypothetical protein